MPPTTTLASPSQTTPAPSFEAYVVPHRIEIIAETRGIVTKVFVAEHDLVERGQVLAAIEPFSSSAPRGADRAFSVRAPQSGRVADSWAAAGDEVGPTRPLLSVLSRDHVLVVARFWPAAARRLRRGAAASVAVRGSSGAPIPATIACVVNVADRSTASDGAAFRCVRVVLSVPTVPPEALWRGAAAEVTV